MSTTVAGARQGPRPLALAKVQLEMMGGVMQDYLNLVHLDGQWWIMAKMWERVGDSEA